MAVHVTPVRRRQETLWVAFTIMVFFYAAMLRVTALKAMQGCWVSWLMPSCTGRRSC